MVLGDPAQEVCPHAPKANTPYLSLFLSSPRGFTLGPGEFSPMTQILQHLRMCVCCIVPATQAAEAGVSQVQNFWREFKANLGDVELLSQKLLLCGGSQYNPRIWEAEAGDPLQIQGQLGSHI